jgi:hypothetical protein
VSSTLSHDRGKSMNTFQLVIADAIEATTARQAGLRHSVRAASASRTSASVTAAYRGTGR